MNCWDKNEIDFHAIVWILGITRTNSPSSKKLSIDLPIMAKWLSLIPMADDGRLYSIYTPDMVVAMRQLVSKAHIVKPNYTEVCFIRYSILDRPY